MAMFGVLDSSAGGLHVYRAWLDAVSDNIANLDTVRPTSEPAFQERFVAAQVASDGSAELAGVRLGDPTGRLVYEPSNPMADADGMVRYPDIDLGDQMTSLILAQRGYQANLAVIERARDSYAQALNLGK
jgi:flagellar basal-body rod protein FlgC